MKKLTFIAASFIFCQVTVFSLDGAQNNHPNVGQSAIQIEIDLLASDDQNSKIQRIGNLNSVMRRYSESFKNKIIQNTLFVPYVANKYIVAIKNKEQWILKLMEVLLDFGCNPNNFFNNQTASHIAAETNNSDLILLLIRYNANVNQATEDMWFSPLHITCFFGSKDVFDILLENKASVSACDSFDATPLHYLVGRPIGSTRTFVAARFSLLPSEKIKPENVEDYNKRIEQRLLMIDALCVAAGKNVNNLLETKDKEYNTVLDIAKKYNRQALVTALESKSLPTFSTPQLQSQSMPELGERSEQEESDEY